MPNLSLGVWCVQFSWISMAMPSRTPSAHSGNTREQPMRKPTSGVTKLHLCCKSSLYSFYSPFWIIFGNFWSNFRLIFVFFSQKSYTYIAYVIFSSYLCRKNVYFTEKMCILLKIFWKLAFLCTCAIVIYIRIECGWFFIYTFAANFTINTMLNH